MILLLFFLPLVVSAQPTGYQEYYVLGNEEHIWRAFLGIYDGPDADMPGQICSTVSLVATADHQVIYYDHHEDGYEADLLNPVQPTTEVYGDGDLSNGGTGSDILLAGDAVNLTSNQDLTGPTAINGYVPVDPVRDLADIRYDGGDRIISSGGPVDLAHAMWPLNNSWSGGSWEIYSRQAHAEAYSYRLPIGEDLYDFGGGDDGAYGDFRNVYLQLGAFEDGTIVLIDNGADVVSLALDRGQTYSSMGNINSTSAPPITINAGTTIRSNKPVQVGLVTGADSPKILNQETFQGRFLMVLSDLLWGADYVVPVPSGGIGDQAEVYLSNPNDFPIRVSAYDAVMQTTFVISPSAYISSTVPYSQKRGGAGYVPQDSAVRFTSSDGVFGVVVTADTSDLAYDWGFSAIPANYLTRDYYVSWAPGNACIPPNDPTCYESGTNPARNGSPVWVTPLADGTVFYVDFSPLDGIVDETFSLNVLQQQRIFDPDKDNTGTHVWATNEFAMSWGEDPRTAGSLPPYLDLGLTTLPLLQRWLDPVLTLDKTASPTTLPSTGGTVTFTLVAHGYNSPLTNVDITDTLPLNWAYVPNSSRVTYPNGSSGNPEPTRDGRVLSWDLSTDLDVNQSLTLSFQAQITNTGGVDVTAFDGFESGDYGGGANWVSDWQEAGDDGSPGSGTVIITDVAPFVGSFGLRIAGNDRSLSRMVDLGDFVSPVLRFVWRLDQLESDDHFYLDVHDGIRWTTALTWTVANQGGSYIQEIVDLTPYASATTLIRFRSGSDVENWDYFYADQVQVYDGIAISVNRGEVVGKDEYSDTLFNPSDEAAVYVNSFDLFKSVSSTQAEIGDTLVYTLSYANPSTFVNTTHVMLRDTVPIQYVTFQSASAGGVYHPVSGAIVWSLDSLPLGASGIVSFTVKVNPFVEDGTVIENVAYITSDQAQAGSNRVRTTVLAPDVQFDKSGPMLAARGQVITYTLTCQNTGGSEATNVLISDIVPDLTAFVPGSMAIDTGSGWVALSDAVDGDQGAFISPTLIIAPGAHAGVIAPGEMNQIRFSVQIGPDLPSNSLLLNSATLDRSLDIPRDSNTVVTRISDLLLSKAAEQAVAAPGDVISYTLTYENVSETLAQTDVYVLEPIPSYTSFLAGSAHGGDQIEYSWDNGFTWSATLPITPVTHLRWYDASIAPGAQAAVSLAVQVNAILPSNTTIQNIARITSAETAVYGWLSSNQVEVETVDLWVEKHVYPSVAQANDWVSYTISYGNHGSADALGVQIQDVLPSGVTYRAGSIWGTGADDSREPTLVWDVATLTAGASAQEVGYVVALDSGLVPGSIITNTAILSSASGLETRDTMTVVVTGPDITVNPAALTVTLDEGDTTTRALTIGNEGVVDLFWDLEEAPDVSWLGVAPMGGATPPQGNDEVTVAFDGAGLAGVYTTMLQISSNDPDESPLNVPITLTVLAPDMIVSPTVLTGTLIEGGMITRTLTISNEGGADLTWRLVETLTVSWLNEAPMSGTASLLSSNEVAITFDATSLAAGVYTTALQVESNDLDQLWVNIPVTLTVLLPEPDIVVSPRALTATLSVSDTTTGILVIRNMGGLDLEWDLKEQPDVPWLLGAPMSNTLTSLGSDEVAIGFSATSWMTGAYTTTLWLDSNDPDEPSIGVSVTLTVLAPDIRVSPDALVEKLKEGDTATRTLIISNVGGVDLTWSLKEVPEVSWLSEGPTSGTVPPLGSAGVAVAFDATGLTTGTYTTTLQINSNDPDVSHAPVTLTVRLDLHPPLPHFVYLPVVAFYRPPILSLTKSADRVVYAGSRLNYSLQVDNSGGLARNLVVSDVLPARTTFGGCDCQSEGDACDASFACGLEGDRVVWSVGELAADSALEMTLWVTVDASLSDGELIVNDDYAAVVDGVKLPSGPPVTTLVRQFHVSVSKTAWPNPVMVGQELTFTIRVTKSGSLLENVQVTDLLPSGVSYVNCGGIEDCEFIKDNDGVTVVWWLGDLDAYSPWELTVRVTVTHASSGTLVNKLYGVEAKAEVGEDVRVWHIMGEPLVIRVFDPAHYVYLPLVLSGSSP